MPMKQSRRAKILYLFAEYAKLCAKAETYSVTSVKWEQLQRKAETTLTLLRTEINNALQEPDDAYRLGQQRVDMMNGSLDRTVDAIARFRLAVRINSVLPPNYEPIPLPANVIQPQEPEGQ